MERREDQSRVPEKPLGGRAPESSRQKAQFHQEIWLDVFFSCPRPPPSPHYPGSVRFSKVCDQLSEE